MNPAPQPPTAPGPAGAIPCRDSRGCSDPEICAQVCKCLGTPSAAGPAAEPPAPITGQLTRAGTFPVRDEECTGLVISLSVAELRAIPSLPMYRRVAVVEAETLAQLHRSASLAADLDALTRSKTEGILRQGWKVTGLMLLSQDGREESCLVDRSAVRWLTAAEWALLMHPPCTTEPLTLGYVSEPARTAVATEQAPSVTPAAAPTCAWCGEEPQAESARCSVVAGSAGFGPWVPAETPPDSWRLVAWAWRGPSGPGGYAAGYYGGEQVAEQFRGWRRFDGNTRMKPHFWCDFPPLPNTQGSQPAR